MDLMLTPLGDEPEPDDPAFAGDWAGALGGLPRGTPPWCFYMAREGGAPVGVGLFKGPPADGAVEIAYLVFLNARGRGVATAVAARLVDIARGHGAARAIAHTLRKANASTRVLAANGFNGPHDADDPEDGPVWRWERML